MDYNEYASQIALVSVQFESKRKPGTFTQKEYTYIADVPLSVGDVVKAPTKSGESIARVSRTNVPLSELQCRVGELRHISEVATPGGDMFSGFYDGPSTEDFVVLPDDTAAPSDPVSVPETALTVHSTPAQEMPPRELIVIKQLPVIEEHLLTVKQEVQAKVAEAVSMVCCDDTLTAVKAMRAELRKEFEGYEDQRKQVHDAIEAPYKQFNEVYKDCVSNIFNQADADLKGKIDTTESGMKNACLDAVKAFFDELIIAKHLEWLPFEKAGIKVSLTDAKLKTQPPEKLTKQITQFVERVALDVERISNHSDAAEIMVEYRQSLDAMGAIDAVTVRHRRIAEAQAAEAARREAVKADTAAAHRVQQFAPTPPPVPAPVPRPVQQAAKPAKDPNEIIPAQFTIIGTDAALAVLNFFLHPNDNLRLQFTVSDTRSHLLEMRQFLIDNGFRFE